MRARVCTWVGARACVCERSLVFVCVCVRARVYTNTENVPVRFSGPARRQVKHAVGAKD